MPRPTSDCPDARSQPTHPTHPNSTTAATSAASWPVGARLQRKRVGRRERAQAHERLRDGHAGARHQLAQLRRGVQAAAAHVQHGPRRAVQRIHDRRQLERRRRRRQARPATGKRHVTLGSKDTSHFRRRQLDRRRRRRQARPAGPRGLQDRLLRAVQRDRHGRQLERRRRRRQARPATYGTLCV